MKRRRRPDPPLSSDVPRAKRRRIVKPRVSVLEQETVYSIELCSGETDERLGSFQLPSNATPQQLNALVRKIQTDRGLDVEELLPSFYTFHLDNGVEILRSLHDAAFEKPTERRLATSTRDCPIRVFFHPQAVFRVRSLTRCTDTLHGHTESILCIQFSPDGRRLATGSGDNTVRLWDLITATPIAVLRGHGGDVLAVSWSPNARMLVSGDRAGLIKIWNGFTGKQRTRRLRRHTKWITGFSWEPFHLNPQCSRFVSCSKDGKLVLWNAKLNRVVKTLSGHSRGISCCRWGGDGRVYSGSQDATIRVWDVTAGTVVTVLRGHAHWINSMSMSTDYVLRRGPYDEHCELIDFDDEQAVEAARVAALRRYETVMAQPLRIVTASDDNTLCVWEPATSETAVRRLMGHHQPVNDVKFSPDGKFVASASFDKSVFVWDAKQGQIFARLRGHVGPVYKLAWSGDSRLLASCSKDSTCKIWAVHAKRLMNDLPGHFDEVYDVDWSPDGQRAASGGRDRTLKM